jgi:uncharacterized damage-inducible protein DinB
MARVGAAITFSTTFGKERDMSIAHALLGEFEHEVQTTRKFLQQLPKDSLKWKPHPKSHSAGDLALHIAKVPAAIVSGAVNDQFPVPDFSKGFPSPASAEEVLNTLEETIVTVRKVLPTIDDAKMMGTIAMVRNGETIMTMPRVGFLRSIMFNHVYHHRGQFGVYLRLLGAKVPSAYGPSGDEIPDFAKAK